MNIGFKVYIFQVLRHITKWLREITEEKKIKKET